MKAHGGVEVHLHAALTLALGGVSGHLHTPAAISSRKEPLSAHWCGWVGLTAGPDAEQKRKSIASCSGRHAYNQISKVAEPSRLRSLLDLYGCDPDHSSTHQFEMT